MTTDRARFENKPRFAPASPVMEGPAAERLVQAALDSVLPRENDRRVTIHRELLKRFPDDASPGNFWHAASSQAFRDFFVWGHDYDWGGECRRSGAMGPRHIEIASESIHYGLFPANLSGKRVLDIGCWSGGDLLILRGLGAEVEAIEEHRKSAASARGLTELLGIPSDISTASVYSDRPDWRHRYDLIYCSGVIYHVTDPMLFLRVCFAYLKVGGTLVLETKALKDGPVSASGESLCGYSGTLEKGWNWFAPNWEALGRWVADAGFEPDQIRLHRRANGRLLAGAVKTSERGLVETAGFSRPGSWLEGKV